MKNFSTILSSTAIALGLASLAIYFWVPALHISPAFPYVLLFLYLSTRFIYVALAKSVNKRTSQFANAVMLVNFGKLLVYGLVIFVYAYFNRSDAVSFILTFFVYYFVFTAIEVFALLNMNKK
ncbi:MAG: hypothetical protein L3J66_03065 [Bacteroidales bacterium]|nr:hypothetical protein [Bacteroidales bacterium]